MIRLPAELTRLTPIMSCQHMESPVFMHKRTLLSLFSPLALCFSSILLAGCETTPAIEDDTKLASLTIRKCDEAMEMSGRVSMNYTLSRNDKVESLHGKFTWKQDSSNTRIDLFSPLGQTMAVVEISPGQVIFTASGKTPVAAVNADELVFRQLGWPLPISGMRNWLQGCATNTNGQFFQANPAQPEITTQDGWQIHYVNWSPFQENQLVPRRIDMTHTPPTNAAISHIQIRLIIDEWQNENEDRR